MIRPMGESVTAPPATDVQGAVSEDVPRSWLADTGLSTRSQIACAWSGLGLIVVVVAGFLLLASMIILLVATFRPDRSPEITQTLNDLGWITLFITVPAFSTQALVIGIATLRNNPPVQVYPRWVGYVNIWVAILFLPALLIPFFKTGAVSWQGALVYWLAFIVFFIWILVLAWAIRR